MNFHDVVVYEWVPQGRVLNSLFFFYKLKVLSTRSLMAIRAVGRSENPRVPVLFGRLNLPPMVEIGLTDLLKAGGPMAPPAPPETTGLGLQGT